MYVILNGEVALRLNIFAINRKLYEFVIAANSTNTTTK